MSTELDFFYFFGSTYTYLAVSRADAVARSHGVTLRWRPFSVRTLMIEQNNRPFVGKPAKLRYMWRDVERRAQRYGIPFGSPPPSPVDIDELVNRVATLASLEGWCPEFTRAAYASWFIEHRDPGEPAILSALLRELGQNPDRVIVEANSTPVRDKYAAETTTARDLGIFGSPTFACGDEIFWGDDRLEDAIEWCTTRD